MTGRHLVSIFPWWLKAQASDLDIIKAFSAAALASQNRLGIHEPVSISESQLPISPKR